MQQINEKILHFDVVSRGGREAAAPPDDDPLAKRIASRPEGALEAVTEKVAYWTQDGRKRVYLIVSFMAIGGRLDGVPVTIERPIEFFLPTGQLSQEYQWISATMRSLSLAARGGYSTQALKDLREVVWDKGPVRCGCTVYEGGKRVPLYHDSECAAIAYAIQQILYRRGFLDAQGNQLPSRVLAARYQARASSATMEPGPDLAEAEPFAAEAPRSVGAAAVRGPRCPACGGETLIRAEGCDACRACGYSRC